MRIALITNPYDEISGAFLKKVNFSLLNNIEVDVFAIKMKHHGFNLMKKITYFLKYVGLTRYFKYSVLQSRSKLNVNSISDELNLPFYFIEINKLEEYLKKNDYDIGIVVSLGHILSIELLDLPNSGFYNFHPGSLTENRGPSPLFWNLYYNDNYITVTLHKMTDRIDVGEIIAQKKARIGHSSERELMIKAGELSAEIFNECVLNLHKKKGYEIRHGVYRKRPTILHRNLLLLKKVKTKFGLKQNRSYNL